MSGCTVTTRHRAPCAVCGDKSGAVHVQADGRMVCARHCEGCRLAELAKAAAKQAARFAVAAVWGA